MLRLARHIVITCNTGVLGCREKSQIRDILEQPSLWVLRDHICKCLEIEVCIGETPVNEQMDELKQFLQLHTHAISENATPPFSCVSLSSDSMTTPKLVRMIPVAVSRDICELRITQSDEKSPATKARECAVTATAAAAVAMINSILATAYADLVLLEDIGAEADAAAARATEEAVETAAAASLAEDAAAVASLAEAAEVASTPLLTFISEAVFPTLVSLVVRSMDIDMDVIMTGLPLLHNLACVECSITNTGSLRLMPSLRYFHLVSTADILPSLHGMTRLVGLVLQIPHAPIADLFGACDTLAGLRKLHLVSDQQYIEPWRTARTIFKVSKVATHLEDLLLRFHPNTALMIPGAWNSLKTLHVGRQISFQSMPDVTKMCVMDNGSANHLLAPLSPSVNNLQLPMGCMPSAIGCSLTSLVCTASSQAAVDMYKVYDALRHGAWSQLAQLVDLPGHNPHGRFWEGVDQSVVDLHCACTSNLLRALIGTHDQLKHATLHHRCSADCQALHALFSLYTLRSVTLVDISVSAEQILAMARMPRMMMIELIGVPHVPGHIPSCEDRVVVDGGRVVRVVWRALDVLYNGARNESSKLF